MAVNQWPGLNEKQAIDEMLENRDSVHWTKCSELMKGLVVRETGKYFPSFSANLVEEIWQNAMVSVITGLPDFRSESKLPTWLTKIAYTRTIDALRCRKRNIQTNAPLTDLIEGEETEVVTYEPAVSGTLEEMCITREGLREVLVEISAYIDSHAKPERNRKIVQRVIFEGQTLEEAAKEAEVSSAVASYVIRTLQRHLQEKFRSSSLS